MTVKEYNELRHSLYLEGLEHEEIRKALDNAGVAYLYEIEQLPDKHSVVILTATTQMNSNMLRGLGFDPDASVVTQRLKYIRQRKIVEF